MEKFKKFVKNIIFEEVEEPEKEVKKETEEKNSIDNPLFVLNDPVVEVKIDDKKSSAQPAASFVSQSTIQNTEKPAAQNTEKPVALNTVKQTVQPIQQSAVQTSPSATRSPFMDIVETKPPVSVRDELTQLINEIQHQKDNVPKYKPRPVISPIFGIQSADVQPSRKTEQKEFLNSSLKSNVISPISRKETLTIIKEDEIDEKIAVMKTSDFVDEVVADKPVGDIYPKIPSFSLPTEKDAQGSSDKEEFEVPGQNEQISLF